MWTVEVGFPIAEVCDGFNVFAGLSRAIVGPGGTNGGGSGSGSEAH